MIYYVFWFLDSCLLQDRHPKALISVWRYYIITGPGYLESGSMIFNTVMEKQILLFLFFKPKWRGCVLAMHCKKKKKRRERPEGSMYVLVNSKLSSLRCKDDEKE